MLNNDPSFAPACLLGVVSSAFVREVGTRPEQRGITSMGDGVIDFCSYGHSILALAVITERLLTLHESGEIAPTLSPVPFPNIGVGSLLFLLPTVLRTASSNDEFWAVGLEAQPHGFSVVQPVKSAAVRERAIG